MWVMKYILKVYEFWTELERGRKRNGESIKLSESPNTQYVNHPPTLS